MADKSTESSAADRAAADEIAATTYRGDRPHNEQVAAIIAKHQAAERERALQVIEIVMSTTQPLCRREPDFCQGLPDKPNCPECKERFDALDSIGYKAEARAALENER
jgi:hypothetical protein